MVRGIRGATTVNENNKEEIVAATLELLETMEKNNGYAPEQISQMIITMTHDLNVVFPAEALRKINGYELVPVMCAQEIPVPNSMEKCIRVMATVITNKSQKEIKHVYLGKAIQLRPDLSLTNKVDSR